MKVSDKKKIIRISRILFIAYGLFLIYFLFFAEIMGRTTVTNEYRYNLHPFEEIKRFIEWAKVSEKGYESMLLNVVGNIVAFVPFGLFLPLITKAKYNVITVTAMGFLTSTLIELIQFFTRVGSFDIDDIILNTTGAFLGYISYRIIRFVKGRMKHGS